MSYFAGVLVAPDTTITAQPWNPDTSTLDHLQSAVGGLIELLELQPDLSAWVNEEGRIHNLPPNPLATALAITLCPNLQGTPLLMGPVVFTGGADDDGNTLPLSPARFLDLVWLCTRLADLN